MRSKKGKKNFFFFLLFLIGKKQTWYREKCGYFRLGKGRKSPVLNFKGLRTANDVSVSNNSFQFQITSR